MPTFSPTGRCWRILAIVKFRPYIISVLAIVLAIADRTVVAQTSRIEQTSQGQRPAAALAESFDGLGAGLSLTTVRNPSDNSIAVGPDHIIQTVNSQIAVFTKKGTRYDSTGRV